MANPFDQFAIAPRPTAPGQAPQGVAPQSDLALGPSTEEQTDPNLHGEEFLKTLPSPSYATQVKAYAAGKLPIPAGFALKAPYFQKLIRDVGQYDPTFDATNYGARSALRKNYEGGGKNYQELQAIGTVAGHLHDMMEAADSLKNFEGGWPGSSILNAGLEKYRELSQDPRIDNFNTVRNAVSRELTKAYQGGHITDSAVGEFAKTLNAAQTPDQLKTVIGKLNDLLASKRTILEEGYRHVMGPHELPEEFRTDNTRTRKLFEDIGNWASGAGGAKKPAAPKPGKYVFDASTGNLVPQ